jgi:hypothetical protein
LSQFGLEKFFAPDAIHNNNQATLPLLCGKIKKLSWKTLDLELMPGGTLLKEEQEIVPTAEPEFI